MSPVQVRNARQYAEEQFGLEAQTALLGSRRETLVFSGWPSIEAACRALDNWLYPFESFLFARCREDWFPVHFRPDSRAIALSSTGVRFRPGFEDPPETDLCLRTGAPCALGGPEPWGGYISAAQSANGGPLLVCTCDGAPAGKDFAERAEAAVGTAYFQIFGLCMLQG